jgi:REP element-mobilizing transposase RayT
LAKDDEMKESGNGVPPLFSQSQDTPIGFFDPDEPVANFTGNLPHWRQDNTTYFVTFRLADSLPRERLEQWQAEKEQWLKAHPKSLTRQQKAEFYRLFPEHMQKWLDAGYGSCILARPDLQQLVSGALRYFHGKRYHLDEYVVATNHVHVIVTPAPENELSSVLHSWKSYTSHEINKRLGRSGEIWQKESFDHIVRSEESLVKFREYIRGHMGKNSGETPLPP